MCVFLTLRLNKAQVKKQYDTRGIDDSFFGPVYVQSAFSYKAWPVITSEKTDRVSMLNWGLIPRWVKDESTAGKIRSSTINARIETIHEKPSFRQAAKSQRCLVLADGFFEFREVNKQKYPYFIQLKNGEPFSMAGLYDNWTNRNSGEILSTFSILTTEANPLMEKIHSRKKRMPVIIPAGQEKDWIGFNIHQDSLSQAYPQENLEAWTVSRLITSRDQSPNVPQVISPFPYPELQMLDELNI